MMNRIVGTMFSAAVFLAASAGSSSAAELVTNGTFSSGLSGWSYSGSGVNVLTDSNYKTNAGGSGSSGIAQYAAFGAGNNPGGSIWQNLNTVVGAVYTLTFDYAGFGSTNTQSLQWTVAGTSGIVEVPAKWLTSNLTGIFNPGTVTFTATSGNTLLQFKDVSTKSAGADMLLANVSVASVPGPIAGAGLPALLGLLGFATLRRQRRAA